MNNKGFGVIEWILALAVSVVAAAVISNCIVAAAAMVSPMGGLCYV